MSFILVKNLFFTKFMNRKSREIQMVTTYYDIDLREIMASAAPDSLKVSRLKELRISHVVAIDDICDAISSLVDISLVGFDEREINNA